MSATLKYIHAPAPLCERGRSLHLSVHPKKPKFIYPSDGNIVIRDLANPMDVDIYYGHAAKQCTAARYAPSGFYICSGDCDGKVRIWDTVNTEEHILKAEFKVLNGRVNDIAWTADSQRIAVVGDGRDSYSKVFMWDAGSTVGTIGGHNNRINAIDSTPKRPFRYVSGAEDFQVNYHAGPPFKLQTTLKDHARGKWSNCVRFDPTGRLFVSVGGDGCGFVYDAKTCERKGDLAGADKHKGSVYSCAWNADGTQLLTASADKTCKLWDVETQQCVTTFTFAAKPAVGDMQMGCLWSGDYMLSTSLNGNINYLDVNNPHQPSQVVYGHVKPITALTVDAPNNRIYSGSYDGTVRAWEGGVRSLPFSGQSSSRVISMAMSSDGQQLLSSSLDDKLTVSEVVGAALGDKVALDSTPMDTVVHGDTVYTATRKGITATSGTGVLWTHALAAEPRAVAVSADGGLLAVGDEAHAVTVYTLEDGRVGAQVAQLSDDAEIVCVRFSPSGAHLAYSSGRKIRVIDTATWQVTIKAFVTHTAKVVTMEWAPSSKFLLSGSLDCDVFVWSLDSPFDGNQRLAQAHPGGVECVAWVNATMFATAGRDCAMRVWELK